MNVRVLGFISLVVGLVLLTFGIIGTQKTGQQVASSVTGQYSSNVMWYIIGGSILAALGAITAFRKK